MKLGKAGWLANLLTEITTLHEKNWVHSPSSESRSFRERRADARGFLKAELSKEHLLLGASDAQLAKLALLEAPDPAGAASSSRPGSAPGSVGATEAKMVLAILRGWADRVMEIGERLDSPPGPRREQVLLLLAILMAEPEVPRTLEGWIRQQKPAPRWLWARMELALEQWASSWAGTPAHGLLLHTGVSTVDARLLAHEALDYFSDGVLHPERSHRRRLVAARRKALLAESLAGLTAASSRPDLDTRRVISRQLDALHLPDEVDRPMRQQIQRLLGGHEESSLNWKAVPLIVRPWLLAQLLLAVRVQGRHSEAERAFVARAARGLGISPATQRVLEDDVSSLHATHRTLVDALGEHASGWASHLRLASVQTSLTRNYARLMQELHETGELSIMLGRVARGYRPTQEERQQMRARLIDVAKAVPALALFAAPGGTLLLIALTKVLPFSLLPSAFQEPREQHREVRKKS